MRIRLIFLFYLVFSFLGFTALAQQDKVELYASLGFGNKGDIVKVEIRVNSFTDILSFQASLNWDPALLSFVAIDDFGIKDFSANNFGTSTTNLGHLRFLWEPADATAISEPDSSILFSASFEIVSNEPQDVPIGYVDLTSSPPFTLEFANNDFEIVPVDSYDAQITIIADPVDLVDITASPNTSCDEKVVDGSLTANVIGNEIDYLFHWFNGTEIKEIPDFTGNPYTDLAAGDYTLQMLNIDGSIFLESLAAVILDAPSGVPDKITVVQNLPQSSCSDDPLASTGLLEITVNDSQTLDAYNISWWKGNYDEGEELLIHKDLFKATQLDAGIYEISVKNKDTNCVSYQQESIKEELVQFSINLSMVSNNFCVDGANGSAYAEVANSTQLDLNYYWFEAEVDIDTTQAISRGQHYTNITGGNYRSWVIDKNSDCTSTKTIEVQDEPIFSNTFIEQRNDTLFANLETANWYREETDLQVQGGYLIPQTSGNYSFTVINEFNCLSESEEIFFGITSLLEPEIETNIFPNPFENFVRVSNSNQTIISIDILDANGGLISEINDIKNKFIDIHLSGSFNGIYLLRVNKASGSITRKVIKNQF